MLNNNSWSNNNQDKNKPFGFSNNSFGFNNKQNTTQSGFNNLSNNNTTGNSFGNNFTMGSGGFTTNGGNSLNKFNSGGFTTNQFTTNNQSSYNSTATPFGENKQTSFNTTPQSPFTTTQSPFTTNSGSSYTQNRTDAFNFNKPNTSGTWNNTSTSITPFTQSNTATRGLIGSSWNSSGNKGTKASTYTTTGIRVDGSTQYLTDITGMICYKDKGIDELRKEDYEIGRKPGSLSTGISTSSMGIGGNSTGGFPSSTGGLTSVGTKFNSSPFPSTSATTYGNSSNTAGTSFWNTSATTSGGFKPTSTVGASSSPFPNTSTSSNPFLTTSTPATTNNPFLTSTANNTTASPFPSTTSPFNTTVTNPFNQTATPNFNTTATTNFNQTATPANLDDPYLCANIKFPEPIFSKPNVKINIPKPIFSYKKESCSSINIKIRPPKKFLQKNIYTIPEDIKDNSIVKNLTVGFEGKGRIEYLEEVTFNNEGLNDILINNLDVIVNDTVGHGYNKRAKVFIENVYAFSRSTGTFLKGKQETWPHKGIQERFIYELKNDISKKFIDYDVETGLYVYEVDHF